MKLSLNMIVRNEAARIERALASAVQFIEGAVIVDTGSTDDTKGVIQRFFDAHKLPVYIEDAPFENWSQARNSALDSGRREAPRMGADALLLMDADMELRVTDAVTFLGSTTPTSMDMYQKAGSLEYINRRIVAANTTGHYRGVTHEYLDIDASGLIPSGVAYFIDHADGSNRPEKFKRDIRLLLADLKTDPDNVRSFYYLAQSYRDAGNLEKAAKWYKRRMEAGGWDEEAWHAHLSYAHCLKGLGDEAGFIREALAAYNRRPTRAEPMYDLANHYRLKGMNAPALAMAEAVGNLPVSTDGLFVNRWVYEAGLKEEIAITGFYVPGKKMLGYRTAAELSLKAGVQYGGVRELARQNLYHYLQPLKDFCPSFKARRIDFDPPTDWVAMNPSVTTHRGKLWCNVRCVNYRINEHGQYIIKASDGTANAENPINTRNFIVQLEPALGIRPPTEVLAPPDLPCKFPLVVGFEDMRLFSWNGDLWTSSTVRQIHEDGNCEQVLARLGDWHADHYQLVDIRRMLRTPRSTEKNWAPIVWDANKWGSTDLQFMWRPGEKVNVNGITVERYNTGMATDHISGSSQLIPWGRGSLGIVHEARVLPGESYKRYYYHRFAEYDGTGKLLRFSLPFVFQDRVIEFCAGMTRALNSHDLVISYGYKDAEAMIATVSEVEVMEFLNAR